jgi:hypothetical protein
MTIGPEWRPASVPQTPKHEPDAWRLSGLFDHVLRIFP